MAFLPNPQPPGSFPRSVWILFVLVAARLLFHTIFIPAYEGPDEPFHLGRVWVFAESSWKAGFLDDGLPDAIVASVRAHACCPDLQRAFLCVPFHGSGAFNILSREPAEVHGAAAVVNYEAHQPPLFYAVAGSMFRLTRALFGSPSARLLALRVISVFLILSALRFPMRALALERGSLFAVAGLLCLLLPGAAEALARGSNDAAIFFWTALTIEKTIHHARSAALVALLALGPLIKLTAFPVVAAVVVALWLERRRITAAVAGLASLLVVGVQAMRGWSWGGTYELNRSGAAPGSIGSLPEGLFRSFYTFVKTVFWLGEWSFFRAPQVLVGIWFCVLAVLGIALLRRNRQAQRLASSLPAMSHVLGGVVAVAGVLLLVILNRRYFGQWGGIGGWYAWGWAPWIAVAWHPDVERRRLRWMPAFAGFVILANVLWFRSALDLYGFHP